MLIVNKIDNKEVLGLNTGVSNRNIAGSNFSNIRKDKGYIFGEQLEEFTLPEVTEVEGKVHIYNKDLNLKVTKVIDSVVNMDDVQNVIRLYMELKNRGIPMPSFSVNLFYKTDSGNFLMMPPEIIKFIDERTPEKLQIESVTKFRHPSYREESSIVYSIGVLIYMALTGSFPVAFSDGEDLRDKIRRGRFIEPVWKNIRISLKANNFILELLKGVHNLTIEDLELDLGMISEGGLYRVKGDYTKDEAKNRKKEEAYINSDRRRSLLIKHRGALIVTGIVIVFLSSLIGTIINGSLKPPLTTGYNSEQVVEAYFQSFENIDPDLIDDVLDKNVRKSDSVEISSLYVMLKARNEFEQVANILTPSKWLELPKEKREVTELYGIHNLKIEDSGNNTFKVSYEKWYSEPVGDDPDSDMVLGFFKISRVEIFTLTETKYSYKISDIKTVSETSGKI